MMIKRLKIFLYCLLHIFFIWPESKKKTGIKNIIIIQPAKLGDMVCTTPMFKAVKNKYPQAYLVVMGGAINGKVLEYNRDVDKYLVWDNSNIFANVNLIKECQCDFGCVAVPNFECLAALILSKIPIISAPIVKNGWSPSETRLYRFVRKFVTAVPHRMGFYAPREYLRLLEPIGIYSSDTRKHLNFSAVADEKVIDFFASNNIDIKDDFVVGISPSAGNKIKQWPVYRFAKIANYLSKKYDAKIMVIGSKGERLKGKEFANYLDRKVIFANTMGIFNIDELKAFISKLDLFISVDTGPIYIAEAFGIPTIDIVGPMDEREQPPIGGIHRVVVAKDRNKPELHIMNARCYDVEEAIKQVRDISVRQVLECCRSLLSKK